MGVTRERLHQDPQDEGLTTMDFINRIAGAIRYWRGTHGLLWGWTDEGAWN